jgi:acetylornithine/N-succinyldiaminopimelate aminotransferase
MKMFDVYNTFDIELSGASDVYLWDRNGNRYLDFYGGHAVISIGHSHPHYISGINSQLSKIGFYSNSLKISQQDKLAEKLGKMSGCEEYSLFLCNSGAEANENALKIASFHNGRNKVLAFNRSFHGRTSLAVAVTDDSKIQAPVNKVHKVEYAPINCIEKQLAQLISDDYCAVIIEGIQGVGGINVPSDQFMQDLRKQCSIKNVFLIVDEIQSGYGRTGKFFAHQYSGIKPDIITVAKGMGNGFPVAGVLVSDKFKPVKGMLGSTFGGAYLACAAATSVLEVIEKENLIQNSANIGNYLITKLKEIPGINEVRGRGLMLGIEFPYNVSELRIKLMNDFKIFTGSSSNLNTIRLLPPMTIKREHADYLIDSLKKAIGLI